MQVPLPCRVYGDIHGRGKGLEFVPRTERSNGSDSSRQLLDLLEFFNAFSWPARSPSWVLAGQ